MNDPKVTMFIKEQMSLMKNPSGVKAKPANKALMNPDKPSQEVDEFEYIITKKPAKKRVEKYLQGLIDMIVEENAE